MEYGYFLLSAFLPPSVMLPPKRLMTLLNQAVEFQIDKCPIHNRPREEFALNVETLLVDHTCSKSVINMSIAIYYYLFSFACNIICFFKT